MKSPDGSSELGQPSEMLRNRSTYIEFYGQNRQKESFLAYYQNISLKCSWEQM